MIAVDTTLLVYAHRADSPFHEPAVACIASLAEGRGAWAIAWPCLHEFVSTATHPKVFNPPTKAAIAIAAICIDNGVRELWSADRDFNRFPSLPVRNPLIG